MIKYLELWEMIKKTSHSKQTDWLARSAWTPDRVFPLLKEAGVIEYVYSKADSKLFIGAQVKYPHQVTPQFLEKFLEGRKFSKCPKMKEKLK